MYREVTMIEVKEVLRLRGEGVPKKRIAAQLGLDPKTVRRYLEIIGDPVSVVEALVVNPLTGASELAVSDDGTLVYVPANRREVPMYWMARDGKPELLRATPANWNSARFSPDGTRIALQIGDGLRSAIWVYDWARDVLSRVTSSSANPLGDGGPVWTNDGRRIVYSSAGLDGGPMSLYWQSADGSADAEPLTHSKNRQVAGSWHRSRVATSTTCSSSATAPAR
jgi:hypothetical protein